MKYIEYDAKEPSPAIAALRTIEINAYENSQRSLIVTPDSSSFRFPAMMMKKNSIMGKIYAYFKTASAERILALSIPPCFLLLSLPLLWDLMKSIGVSDVAIVAISQGITLFPLLPIFLFAFLNSFNSSTLVIKGVGEHFDDEISEIYAKWEKGNTSFASLKKDIIEMIMKKDPAGVSKEFSDNYKKSIQEEIKKAEEESKKAEEESKKHQELAQSQKDRLEEIPVIKEPLSTLKIKQAQDLKKEEWEKQLTSL